MPERNPEIEVDAAAAHTRHLLETLLDSLALADPYTGADQRARAEERQKQRAEGQPAAWNK